VTDSSTQTQPAFLLLDDPAQLGPVTRQADPDALLQRLGPLLQPPLNNEQVEGFRRSFDTRASLLWGPPGTGKTTVLSAAILGWLERAALTGEPVSIGVGASNWKAINLLLEKVAKLVQQRREVLGEYASAVQVVRVRSDFADPLPEDSPILDVPRDTPAAKRLVREMEASSQSFVVGGTWQQLSKLAGKLSAKKVPVGRWFDLLILDESSQVRVAPAEAYFLLLKEDGNVVLAGDHRQLGPILQFEVQDTMQGLFDCVFTFMDQTHQLRKTTLVKNYRTNEEIAAWPRERFYENAYESAFPERRLSVTIPQEKPDGWPDELPWISEWREILDPDLPIAVITYPTQPYTLSNPFEAQLIAAVASLYRLSLPADPGGRVLWENRLGIVTPHRAQVATIRNLLQRSNIFSDHVPVVDTVDRFQGQEREVILSSYAVADRDFARSEEKFILEPRRFNVTLTRAERKFVMLISDTLVQHLPSDAEVASSAAHMQLFVAKYCTEVDREMVIPFWTGAAWEQMQCRLRGRRRL
jgi:AAA domain-containing protein